MATKNEATLKPYAFRFYVTEETDYTNRIFANILQVLDEKIAGQYDIEIINVLFRKDLAVQDKVGLTPVLVRLRPEPTSHCTGNFRSPDGIRRALSFLESAKS